MSDDLLGQQDPDPVHCRQCDRVLSEGEDREVTTGGVFCVPCFAALKRHLEAELQRQGTGINHVNAALGGVVGGALGAAIWWGFTVITRVSFGLVAVVIGFLVGKGIVMASGGKRAVSLQVMSMVIAAVAYAFASYLVNRSFLLKAIAADPSLWAAGAPLPLLAPPGLMFAVIRAGFEVFDLVFLAIVVYQAWKMPAPFKLAR
jgi:hypothetical protein